MPSVVRANKSLAFRKKCSEVRLVWRSLWRSNRRRPLRYNGTFLHSICDGTDIASRHPGPRIPELQVYVGCDLSEETPEGVVRKNYRTLPSGDRGHRIQGFNQLLNAPQWTGEIQLSSHFDHLDGVFQVWHIVRMSGGFHPSSGHIAM